MRFAQGKGEVIAEKIADGQRFVLKPWQYEMMRRFDGKRTFEEIAREIYGQFRGEFSGVGLTNFYQWLYDENLVFCECDSIFELLPEEGPAKPPSTPSPQEYAAPLSRHAGITRKIQETVREGFGPSKDWQKKALRISAIVLFSLAVLRIAYVSAPILEPPVDHAYSSIEGWFYQDATPPAERRAVNEIRETPVQEMELAGRAPAVAATEPIETDPVAAYEAIPEPGPSALPSVADLEVLRREMAECRIRRDEFYLQNNEIGYRYEVQKMTALAKQIGEIEALLD